MRGLKSKDKLLNDGKSTCRIPHGMRGLKFFSGLVYPVNLESHPAWDAWIEIKEMGINAKYAVVASRMGCVD